MSIKNVLAKATFGIKKHSPAILTGAGVVGLGATAYLAYKSRSKVEAVVEKIEDQRELAAENGEEFVVDKVEVAKDIAEAIYLPVVVGALSVSAFILSYKIQNNRITLLASALAASQAHQKFMEDKYRKLHGDEEFNKFIAPTEQVVTETVDGKGKTKQTVQEVKSEVDKTIGQWYDESIEYVSDDHTYNMAYIDSVDEQLQTILFARGSLMLNEVREALGLERIRAGALLGWTTQDNFSLDKVVTMIEDEGTLKEQIWVTWTRPRYVYDEVEFNGRYSVY